MPNIAAHQSAQTTKLLYIGDSSAGKTGSLASLAAAGYKLRILDLDNGLDILKNYVTDTASPYVKQNPKCAENVQFMTLTDPKKNIGGNLFTMKPTVWSRTISMLHHWKELGPDGKEVLVDYGPITSWDTQTILVIDSLSALSTAALNFDAQMNAMLGRMPAQNEGRRAVGRAQNLLRSLLEMLADESVRCNVIVTSHITLVTEQGLGPQNEEAKGEPFKGYPSAIGRALSPHIPRYFNSVLEASVTGNRHVINTKTRGTVLCKSTAPLRVKDSYDLATGLAEYFTAVRSAAQKEEKCYKS